MNNINIIKAIQCLIGSNCLVSTPEAFYVGPKGYVSNTSLQGSIKEHSNSIDAILKELVNKITEEDLKTINGISLVGEGNIEISGQGGSVDLSGYLTKKDANDLYPSKNSVVYNTESILDVSKLHIKKNNGETFEDYNGPLQGGTDLWISKDSYQELYDFLSQKPYNSLLYDGHFYYSIIGIYSKESSKEIYDNALTVLLVNKNTLYLFKLGETTLVSDDYPVAIKLEVFVNKQAVIEANSYTNQKISKLDPQHVLITKNRKDFSKQSNVGRLLYLTEELQLSYRFENDYGYSLYTSIQNAPEGGSIIYKVSVYSDKLLTELFSSDYGEISFSDEDPYKLYSKDNIEFSYKETSVLTTGIYYLNDVNDPILIASEGNINKVQQCVTREEAKVGFVEKELINYNAETVNLNHLDKTKSLYVVQYNNPYNGKYYSDIAYITIMGPYVYVKGLVQVDNTGTVYFSPNNATDDLFYNKSANTWSKIQDSSVKAELDNLNNKIKENTRDIKVYGEESLKYYCIGDLSDYEYIVLKWGDTIEIAEPFDIPSYTYLTWLSEDGQLVYTEYFDIHEEWNWTGSACDDRYMSSVLDTAFELSNDGKGLYIRSDIYDGGSTKKFYFNKQISQGLNDEIARKVSIVTSQGFKTLVNL